MKYRNLVGLREFAFYVKRKRRMKRKQRMQRDRNLYPSRRTIDHAKVNNSHCQKQAHYCYFACQDCLLLTTFENADPGLHLTSEW